MAGSEVLQGFSARFPTLTVCVAFRHLLTGEAWAVDGDRLLPPASLIKVPIAAAAYRQAEAGRLDLDARVRVRHRVVCGDGDEEYDDLAFSPPGTCMTVRKLVDRMLTESDNTATNLVIRLLASGRCDPQDGGSAAERRDAREQCDDADPTPGMAVVNAMLAAWGFERTRLNRLMGTDGPENTTTAQETVDLLVRLWEGTDALSEAHRTEFWALMGQQRDRTKLPRRMPPGVRIYHKTGELPGFRHDAGILDPHGTGGGPFALAVLVEGADADRLGNSAIGWVVRGVWARYRDEPRRFQVFAVALEERVAALGLDPRERIAEVAPAWREGRLVARGRCDVAEVGQIAVALGARDEIAWLPGPGAGSPARVSVPLLQLRRSGAHAAELVTQAPMGTPVEVLERTEEWWHVRMPDGYLGWGRSANFRDAPWPGGQLAMVVVAMAHVGRVDGAPGRFPLSGGSIVALEEVGPDGEAVAVLVDGRRVRMPADTWARVVTGGQDAPLPARVHDAARILALAEEFVGLPYVWGGASGWGVDCSGFVQLLYRMAGHAIPRDADQQQATTRPIAADPLDRAAMRPGDLAFFPGHVALYLGDGALLHASSPAGQVVCNTWIPGPAYSAWLDENFTGWGRVLT